MTTKSNRNGRAFEAIVFYDLVNHSKNKKINFSITERGYTYHKQDMIFFNELADGDSKDIKLRDDYLKNVHLITQWLFDEFNIKSSDSLLLDKLPDNAGKKGDITDIRIILNKSKEINLSLKNNSNALKHSRIASIPQWLGISEDSNECKEYIKEYNSIWKDVTEKIDKYNSKSTKKVNIYNQLKLISKDFKSDEIYDRYYNLIENFFVYFCCNPTRTNQLFRYLIGDVEYYKIINKSKKIHIAPYANIASPTQIAFSRNLNNYLLLTFNNDWKISIRLHNGDNKLSPSLKVDAQFDKGFKVPEIVIQK